MFCKILGIKKSSAKVLGGTLVLSLPDAITPIVWTLDIGKDGHGALKIETDEKKGETALIYSSPKKNVSDITVALYAEKAKALNALMQATSALSQQAIIHGENTQPGMHYAPAASPLKKNVTTIVGILLLTAVFLFLTTPGQNLMSNLSKGKSLSSSPSSYASSVSSEMTASPEPSQPDPDSVGVPMDANNFFYK